MFSLHIKGFVEMFAWTHLKFEAYLVNLNQE